MMFDPPILYVPGPYLGGGGGGGALIPNALLAFLLQAELGMGHLQEQLAFQMQSVAGLNLELETAKRLLEEARAAHVGSAEQPALDESQTAAGDNAEVMARIGPIPPLIHPMPLLATITVSNVVKTPMLHQNDVAAAVTAWEIFPCLCPAGPPGAQAAPLCIQALRSIGICDGLSFASMMLTTLKAEPEASPAVHCH